ncbi:MAG: hypothetical protein KA198_10170 [Chitinophagaceae bacterium]|nr:hypothetical protein [Chitinophagaceae bacterium]
MRRIIALSLMSIFLISTNSDLMAKPKVKGTIEVQITFGKRKKKDEDGNCPEKGICTLTIKGSVEPAKAYQPGNHSIAINENGELIIIVDKYTLNKVQPEKVSDFHAISYPFLNELDIIPSEITELLHVNNGQPIHLHGDYKIEEHENCYIIILGKF